MSDLRCGALNADGSWCKRNGIEANDYWRCKAHSDWHDTAAPADKQRLAYLQIEAMIHAISQEDDV